MKNSKNDRSNSAEIKNKRAAHEYCIGEKFEAGIVLLGPEVKSLREGRAQITEAFVRLNKGNELFLYNAHIAEYKFCDTTEFNTVRPKKLLLHKSEIKRITIAIEREKSPVIPLRIFFKNGMAKAEIAICKGKKLFDKRETLKTKEATREAERAISAHLRGTRR